MLFADTVYGFPSDIYKHSVETKLAYLETNIVSALDLATYTENPYRKKQWEQYACGQAEILTDIIDVMLY